MGGITPRQAEGLTGVAGTATVKRVRRPLADACGSVIVVVPTTAKRIKKPRPEAGAKRRPAGGADFVLAKAS